MEEMADEAIPMAEPTLVRYDPPVSVTTTNWVGLGKKGEGDAANPNRPKLAHCAALKESEGEIEKILSDILPPRLWEAEGKMWRQQVSSVPATRSDVIGLQELLDRRLKEGKARETGICHVRRALYTQFFEELIRQVVIVSSNRGILLFRIRSEIRMTLKQLETLYESATAYGIRKGLAGEAEKDALEKAIYQRGFEIIELRKQVEEARQDLETLRQRAMDKREVMKRSRALDVARIKELNEGVKAQIWTVLFPKAVMN